MDSCSVVIAGVGGQGVLSASRLLAQAVTQTGQRVIVGDTFGASQREGSVMSVVRLGADVRGALIAPGDADFLIAFEPYEALRRLHFLRQGGTALVDSEARIPVRVSLEGGYPAIEDVWRAIGERAGRLVRVDASSAAGTLARKHGSHYNVTNVVILGAASVLRGFPIDKPQLLATIEARFRAKSLPMNLEAFSTGVGLADSLAG